MNTPIKTKSWLYPGSIWIKRISKTLLICSVGFNLFLNTLQDHLLHTSQKFIELSRSLDQPAGRFAEITKEQIIPLLEYIENSRLSGLTSTIPSSKDLNTHVANYTLLQSTLDKNAVLTKYVGLILKIANILFWIPISFAGLWLLYDIQYGNTKIITVILLISSLWFNYWSFDWLTSNIIV